MRVCRGRGGRGAPWSCIFALLALTCVPSFTHAPSWLTPESTVRYDSAGHHMAADTSKLSSCISRHKQNPYGGFCASTFYERVGFLARVELPEGLGLHWNCDMGREDWCEETEEDGNEDSRGKGQPKHAMLRLRGGGARRQARFGSRMKLDHLKNLIKKPGFSRCPCYAISATDRTHAGSRERGEREGGSVSEREVLIPIALCSRPRSRVLT